MTYLEILNKVNTYMNGSGVRGFCRNVCSGTCCLPVADYTCSPYKVDRCDSRLPCSLYMCDYVEANIINEVSNGETIIDLIREVDRIICSTIREVEGTANIYLIPAENHSTLEFNVPDLTILDNPQKVEGLSYGDTN